MPFKYLERIAISILIIVISSITFNHAQIKLSALPEGVSISRLDNGIEVMLIEKPSLPMVGINTLVKVGSAYENFSSSGMSHMLEHLLFNGTNTMTQKELYDSTDIIGGYNNAHTGRYFTNFMMVTPFENILEGMKLQSAMLFESVLPEEKFAKEKGIVLEEIAKSLAKSSEEIERNINSIIYSGHALSLPILGTYSTIENMNRDDVYDFYKNYYVPNNMIITVIGKFETKEMLDNIKAIYGKYSPGIIKRNRNSNLSFGFNEKIVDNNNKVFHRFYNGEKTHLQLFFEIDNRDRFEFSDILKLILDKHKESLKKDLAKVYGDQIEGIEFLLRESPIRDFLQVSLVLMNNLNLDEIKNTLVNSLANVEYELSPQTIENESIKSRTRFLKNTEKPHMFGIYNASVIAEKGIEGILASYSAAGYRDSYEVVKHFKLPDDVITIVHHALVDDETDEIGNESNIELFENYANGAQVISKESPGSELLAIHYLIKNKAMLEHKHGKNAAKIWHAAFGKRMDSPEVQKLSSKFGLTFTVNDNPYIPMDNIYLSPEFGYIRVEGLADSVEAAVKFLNDQVLNFIPTESEFEGSNENSMMPSMMGHGNKAKMIFDAKLKSLLYNEDEFESGEKDLTYETLLEFGKEYFIPSNMIISVVSPVDNELVKEYFAELVKEGDSNNGLGRIIEFRPITKPEKIDLEGGGEQSYLYFGFQKKIQESEKAALKVLSLILSDNITFDIREKQGLAYRMSAGIDYKRDKAMFYINMETRPENVEKLVSQFPSFFTKDFSKIITNELVKKAVNMYLGRMMFRRLSSINQAYYLGYSKYFYDDINYDTNSLDALKNVDAGSVLSMIDKYMTIENPIEIYVR